VSHQVDEKVEVVGGDRVRGRAIVERGDIDELVDGRLPLRGDRV